MHVALNARQLRVALEGQVHFQLPSWPKHIFYLMDGFQIETIGLAVSSSG